MKRSGAPRSKSRRPGESGYAMLMALAMMAMMIIASTVVMTNMRTRAKRAREREMVWRGRQYVTAIRRFYRRSGRYPQNLDELENGVANIHFLRQAALKDPMNTDEDGKWRFIYTNASGQIIGSVHYATMQQMALLDLYAGKVPGAQGNGSDSSDNSDEGASNATSSNETNSPDQGSSSANQNCPPASSFAPGGNVPRGFPGGGAVPGGIANGLSTVPASGAASQNQAGQSGTDAVVPVNQPDSGQTTCPQVQAGVGASMVVGVQLGMQQAALQALMSMKPTGPVDSPVIGGFLVGVGSTVDRKSVRIYKGGKKYKDWEFIWNPLEEQALAMQQAMGQGGGIGALGGLMNPTLPNGTGMPGIPGGAMGGPGAGPGQAPGANPLQPPQQIPQQDQQ